MKSILKVLLIASCASIAFSSANAQSKNNKSSFYEKCSQHPYDSDCHARNHYKALGVVGAGIIGLGILGAIAGGSSESAPAKKTDPVNETNKRNQNALNNAELILKFLE